jgi:Family of unknown function (DUF6152)
MRRLVLASLIIAPLDAHHSFMAEYDAAKSLHLTGVIREFDFVNPHAEIALDADGVCWQIELSSPSALARRGVSKSTIRAGMRVTINAYPAKDGSHRAYGLDLVLPDERRFLLNGSI